jgi:Flp pilus assembly protein TadG
MLSAFALPRARRAAAVKQDRRGAVLVEFGMIVIPFMALVMASLHTSLVYFTDQTLETLTERKARLLMTGEAQKASLTAAQFKAKVCLDIPSFLDCNRLYVEVKKVDLADTSNPALPTLTFDANGLITNSFAYDTIDPGEMAMVRILYLWPTGMGPMGVQLANAPKSSRLLISTSVIRAEPY